jgi:hypothetical protein
MSASSAAHKNRHYKTLIVLVLSMTMGTLFLFWLGKFTPVTPLRASTGRAWHQISVRSVVQGESDGFYHLKVNGDGQVVPSSASERGQANPLGNPDTIQIVLRTSGPDSELSVAQTKALSKLIANLCKKHSIAANQVFADSAAPRTRTPRAGDKPLGS